MKKKPKTKIEEKKLGREKALGQAFRGEDLIQIDPRQDSKEYLDTLIHEALHILFPDWSEKKVLKTANKLSEIVWEQNYRRIMK